MKKKRKKSKRLFPKTSFPSFLSAWELAALLPHTGHVALGEGLEVLDQSAGLSHLAAGGYTGVYIKFELLIPPPPYLIYIFSQNEIWYNEGVKFLNLYCKKNKNPTWLLNILYEF